MRPPLEWHLVEVVLVHGRVAQDELHGPDAEGGVASAVDGLARVDVVEHLDAPEKRRLQMPIPATGAKQKSTLKCVPCWQVLPDFPPLIYTVDVLKKISLFYVLVTQVPELTNHDILFSK